MNVIFSRAFLLPRQSRVAKSVLVQADRLSGGRKPCNNERKASFALEMLALLCFLLFE